VTISSCQRRFLVLREVWIRLIESGVNLPLKFGLLSINVSSALPLENAWGGFASSISSIPGRDLSMREFSCDALRT